MLVLELSIKTSNPKAELLLVAVAYITDLVLFRSLPGGALWRKESSKGLII